MPRRSQPRSSSYADETGRGAPSAEALAEDIAAVFTPPPMIRGEAEHPDEVPAIQRLLRHPTPVLLVAGLVTAASLAAVPSVRLRLQPPGTCRPRARSRWPGGRASSRPLLAAPASTALVSADSLEELRRCRRAFRSSPTVSEVDSVLRLIPDDQPEKIALMHQDLRPPAGRAGDRIGRSSPVDLEHLAGVVR